MIPMQSARLIVLIPLLWAATAQAWDCTGLPEWKRQHYYLEGDQVQYQGNAYQNEAVSSKRDKPNPDDDYPWFPLGVCEDPGSGDDGGDDGSGGTGGAKQPISIYGVWHCGNSFCDWSQVRDMAEFDRANRWIIDADGVDDENFQRSVNLVVLSFLKPMELMLGVSNGAFVAGIPAGMTPEIVDYFSAHDIRVLLSMGGVTYTDSWNQALVTDAARLAENAAAAVVALGADGLEIDWENGTPSEEELAGIETFIDTYHSSIATYGLDRDIVLTLDLAVGTRYLQELSRRAAADWLPNGKIDYINAMVPRREPSTDQWLEHVEGKSNYDPPILPKAPAKIAVSLWLTDSRRANANCTSFSTSSQLANADFVQTVQPRGAGTTHGFLGFMFWAAECPSSRNVCTTPPNGCEGGIGAGAAHFEIPVLHFDGLRPD
jgi:hypothetical protein